jgi:LysM repeat protein
MAATAIATAALIWFGAVGGAQAASDGAQAASHGQPLAVAHRGLFQVVVRPGETLWSIARQAEPSADPRIVVQQIIDVNALSGPTIQAGELLWVPAG